MILLLVLIFLSSCANRSGLGGGPVDNISPTVIESYPAVGSLSVDINTPIYFIFSEWVDNTTTRQSIFVTPTEPSMSIKISGRKVSIIPKTPLLNNTTYTITVGTSAKDLRGNQLESSFSTTFSTGKEIDTSSITGTVIDPDGFPAPSGTAIFAYKLTNNLDTAIISPADKKPLFITECGINGAFKLTGLAIGTYRLFGVQDNNRNRKLDIGKERFFMAIRDAVIENSGLCDSGLLLVESPFDTTRLAITSIKLASPTTLFVSFNIKLDLSFPSAADFSINPLSESNLTTKISPIEIHKSTQNDLILDIPILEKGKYRLTLRIQNEIIDSIDFNHSGMEASPLYHSICKVNPLPKARAVSPYDSISFLWNSRTPIDFPPIVEQLTIKQISDSLSDTLKTAVKGRYAYISPYTSCFVPMAPFTGGGLFIWRFPDSVRLFDTLAAKSFFTIQSTIETGAISGLVKSKENTTNIMAVAVSLTNKKRSKAIHYGNGRYKIDNLEEGYYRVLAFNDANMNGTYDAGTLLKNTMSPETIAIIADSIAVRKRWEVENVDIDW